MLEIEKIINKLHKSSLESNLEEYNLLIEMSDSYKHKVKIFKLISQNSNDHSLSFPLYFQLITKLKNNYEDELVIQLCEYFKNLKSTHEYDWIAKIIFLILEFTKDRKKNNEIKLLILEIIKMCASHINIINYIYNFLLNEGSSEIVYAILVFIPEISDEFVRMAIQQTNQIILKNCSLVLVSLCQTQRNLFINFKHFDVFLDSEHYFLRNCYLEIIFNLVEIYKEIEDIEGINNIIFLIKERLHDVYFNVRYKALTLLGQLFENNCVPLDIRNSIIKSIGDRILDKTVLVRKKAVMICNNLLINNPFISEFNLSKKESVDPEKIKYYEDLNEFHDVIKSILEKVMTLLNSGSIGDNQVFLDFIKLCLYYEIEGSKDYFEQTFDLVWETDSIISCFKDILIRLKARKISIISFLKKFVNQQRNKSFEKIIRELYKKGIINIYEELLADIFRNKDLYETSFLLSCLGKYLDNSKFYELLVHTTDILFSISTTEDLHHALNIYINILKLRIKHKESEDSKIIALIVKNIVKMTFLDFQVIQDSISLIYRISKEPEIPIKNLIKSMNNKNLNLLKMIYCVGCIGLNHLKHLDLLEKISKSKKEKITVIVPEDIKERRKSINASRMSLQSFIEEDDDRNKSKIKKESLDTKNLDDKTEEEISDFFFYLKEKDIFYNKDGLLYDFAKIIPEFCTSEDKDLQEVAYLALFNLMCVSSEYFLEHKNLFINAFKNDNVKIRANAIISMGDFLLFYNSLVENNAKLLFNGLTDQEILVRKNALLTIYSLLKRNIIRLGSNSIYLTNLVFDDNEEIKSISRNIIYGLSENENYITTIVYEKLSHSDVDYTKYIEFFIPLLKDKSKETIFLKLLRTAVNKEVLKFMFNKFNFVDKFLEDIKHIEEFKKLEIKI